MLLLSNQKRCYYIFMVMRTVSRSNHHPCPLFCK
ncbi:hypothetical protein [Escherichia phage UPEC06]|nr:hypothetical protein [Escherichia phage UPEC06]